MCECGCVEFVSICGKTSDCFTAEYKGEEYDGYVPDELEIGSGDYVEFMLCPHCGRVQGVFPIMDNKLAEVFRKEG